MNVVGGYVVTDRMLQHVPRAGVGHRPDEREPVDTTVQLIYLAAAACFVIGLHLMNTPATARRGNQLSAAAWRSRSPPPPSC